MVELAINGGKPVRRDFFPSQFDFRESKENYLKDIDKILDSNILSAYRGNHTPNFWGGNYINKLEEEFVDFVKGQHGPDNIKALAVNSCTSGLYIACGAIGLKPGDEVIVTPWSMTCSATVPLAYGAIPVFCDIDKDNFCIDPNKISALITANTKAIIMVDLFGNIPNYDLIREIADLHHLYIIEDAAQALGASRSGRYAGSFGDIACFSFTQGKHITCGEGGMITTSNSELYTRCAMIRNHAESVCNDMSEELQQEYSSLLGLNFRMTEIQAAIILHQLISFNSSRGLSSRLTNTWKISREIQKVPCFSPIVRGDEFQSSYYVLPFMYDSTKCRGVHRDKFLAAVRAELKEEADRLDRGVPIGGGYIKPLYLFPIFWKMEHWAFDNHWRINIVDDNELPQIYKEGLCPVCEDLWKNSFCLTLYNGLHLTDHDIKDIGVAFKKVYDNIEELI